jgi:hypothetical protein
MKTWMCRGILSIAFVLLALNGTAWAQANDIDGCSNATLKGDYAFVVSGEIFTATGPMLRQGVAMTRFDGDGHLTQVDFVINTPPSGVSAPVPSPDIDMTTKFHINEWGTYTVNRDCTGDAVINFPAASGTGATINLMFVLSDQGRAIHTVVSSVIPPSLAPPILGASIHSDGYKLGSFR